MQGMSWFCFSLFTSSHFLQVRPHHPSWLSRSYCHISFPSSSHSFFICGHHNGIWWGLYLVTWVRNTRGTSAIVVSSENYSETLAGVINNALLFLVHINTQIPFPYCSPIIKDSKVMHLCIGEVMWIELTHLSHSNRSLKRFCISLHCYSCWAGQW